MVREKSTLNCHKRVLTEGDRLNIYFLGCLDPLSFVRVFLGGGDLIDFEDADGLDLIFEEFGDCFDLGAINCFGIFSDWRFCSRRRS